MRVRLRGSSMYTLPILSKSIAVDADSVVRFSRSLGVLTYHRTRYGPLLSNPYTSYSSQNLPFPTLRLRLLQTLYRQTLQIIRLLLRFL